jgi:hypothetical protein
LLLNYMEVRMTKRLRWMALTAVAALALPLALACGDDDDGGGGGGGGSGSDEDYVAAICAAQVRFQEAGEDLEDELADVETEEDAVDIILEPLRDLVSDFEDANPPDDAAEYHETVVAFFQSMVDTLDEEKSIAALEELEELPEPPADISARLDEAAAENQDCIDAGFTFSG